MKKFFTLIAAAVTAMSLNAAEIFSFTSTAEGNVSVEAGSDMNLSDYATISGGTATVHNGHSTNAANLITAAGVIMTNSGGSYMKVVLDQPLEAGDKINVTMGSGSQCGVLVDTKGTATKGGSADNLTDGAYTVTAAEEGATVILFNRGANNSATRGAIYSISIFRDNSKVKAPEIKVVDGKVVMTCATVGATILFENNEADLDDFFSPDYKEPIEFTATTDYYAMAIKDGMTNSDVVKFRAVKATGELGTEAVFGSNLEAGEGDVALEQIATGGMVLKPATTSSVLSASAPYESTENPGVTFPGLVKVKADLILTANAAVITGLRISGINNANTGSVVVKASGMECSTGANLLRGREEITTPDVVEFAVIGEPVQETTINFSAQARVKIEVFLTSADGVQTIETIVANPQTVKKAGVNGVEIIAPAAIYNVGGQMK